MSRLRPSNISAFEPAQQRVIEQIFEFLNGQAPSSKPSGTTTIVQTSGGGGASSWSDFTDSVTEDVNFIRFTKDVRFVEIRIEDDMLFLNGINIGRIQWAPTADHILSLPDATDTLVGRATTDTLTNKTITAAGNTISGLTHGAEVDNPVSGVHGVAGSVVGTSDGQTLTNKTIDGALNTLSNLLHGTQVDNPASGVHGVTGNVVGTTDDQELTTKVIVLKAGSATKAPFAFSAGPLLTTPLAGAAEFNNNRLYVTEVGRQRAVSVADDVPTATTTVANTITETTVYTAPIAANELKVGKMYRIVVLGRYSTANATDTVTIKVKIGATELSSTVSTAANVSDAGVFLRFYLTVRATGATGSIVSYTSATFDSVDQDRPGSGPVTVDTTVAEDVTVTATWSAADPGNTLAIEQAVSEVLN